MPNDITAKLEEILGKGRVEKNKDLYPYLTLKTHTIAEFFFEANSQQDLINVKRISLFNLPYFLMGGGSNLAMVTDRIKGLVVKNNYKKIEIINDNDKFTEILATSGVAVSQLVNLTIEKGLEGLEYHKGLPGTVGGAIYMNSKWTKPLNYFGDWLLYAHIINSQAEVQKVDRKFFKFDYDFSFIQTSKDLVLEAVFHLKKADPQLIKKRADEAFEYRKKTQPFGRFSSGCFFKNISVNDRNKLKISSSSAGYLIEKAGLKGYQIGAFVVSDKHANFIINMGGGDPKDLLRLIEYVKNKVNNKFGVKLEEEVIIV
ncbi:MAG: UDP-N-acetylenolpyruvoylglucosamine reductase [Candidatus Roizmanbacteria bacterium GW2011_GWA2_36_23]|uniref:UDP-N-acetylenolpyruvoylglucosamine reductase n=1 Tax=Candidatus Roizmanbacteria bacterium GW2011_GWA2_36_23 TaxID=1618480 RepID=A0A0G0HDA5_9BACT|nr:MAG: UDP-N-acetylenolpyruvoylglucosamine reductase [Candidatus Roizmanbacteria bacterium GW2011_GWA2_36_23]